MILINKNKIQAHLHSNYIDIEELCKKAKIDRNKFYCYLAHSQMPKSTYKRLCKALNKNEKEFIGYENL